MKTKPPRAWWENKMYEVADYSWNTNRVWLMSYLVKGDHYGISLRTDVIVMWPTGILSKSGTEIYERDIIKDGCDWIGEIVWDSKDWVWAIRFQLPDGVRPLEPCFEMTTDNWEIIGNSLQHPNLLKKESP